MVASSQLARRESRLVAVAAVFSWLSREKKISLEQTTKHSLSCLMEVKNDAMSEELTHLVQVNFAKFRVVIKALAPDFPLEKMALINQSVLLTGMAEMKQKQTPPVVVINEYIEIAKDLGEQRSAGLVNGVLDAWRENLNLPAA